MKQSASPLKGWGISQLIRVFGVSIDILNKLMQPRGYFYLYVLDVDVFENCY